MALITGNSGTIKFNDGDSSNYVTLAANATTSANVAYTLPAADGSSGHFLSTNASGVLSWAAAGGGDLVLINSSNTTSNVSSLEVTLTGSYETYLITGSDFKAENDIDDLRVLFGTSSIYSTTGYHRSLHVIRSDNTHSLTYHSNLGYMSVSSTCGSGTGEGVGFSFWFTRPIGTADVYPHMHGTMCAVNHNTIIEAGQFAGMLPSDIDVAKIKVYFSTGDVNKGRLTVWGLNHA